MLSVMNVNRADSQATAQAMHRADAPVALVADPGQARSDGPSSGITDSGGRCGGCEGRGWRVVSEVGRLRLDEGGVRLVTRPCPDCVGVESPGVLAV